MKIGKNIFGLLLTMTLSLWQVSLWAQSSSLNTFSPYTFYGIGDIHEEGIAVTRAMGGASIGFRNSFYVNVTNPASYSSVRSNSFLSNFDMEGQNIYARTMDAKTSFNTFNVRDIAMSFPLIKGMGVGLSVTPYSSVGYRVQHFDDSPEVQANIGQMLYSYTGSGDVTQFKLGLGYEVVKNLSFGAELIYYHGLIEREYSAVPTVITGTGSYHSILGLKSESVNSFYGKLGVQWTPLARRNTVLTVGATYQMGGKMGNEVENIVAQNSTLAPDVFAVNEVYISNFSMPNIYAVGFFLHKDNYSVGADYQFADWGTRNRGDVTATRSFRNTNTVRLGGQYTPNPGDVRHALNRWTYRAGVRYSQYYIVINDQPFDDVALTFGVGVPLRMTGLSNVNLGLELGSRGTTKAGLSRENYLKFTIGFSLFGEDYWFVKAKYD